jgi:non-ribosomal peptide synthetase component E (peptide arylation enzyme)
MFQLLEGAIPYREADAEEYTRQRWWSGLTFGDLLDRAADIHPDREAFVDRDNRVTYAQARQNAERLAIGLLKLGIEPLDRVMVQLPNWTEFVTAYFACQKIGAITLMLIDRYRQHEIERLAEIAEAKAWIVPAQYGKTDFMPIVHDVRERCPEIAHIITVR